MPVSRTIVVPPFQPAGTLALAAIVGVIPTGVVQAVEAVERASTRLPLSIQGAVILGSFVGVLLVVAFVVARRTARRGLCVLAGIVAGGAFPLSMAVWEFARLPPSFFGGFFDPRVFVVVLAYGAVGGIVCFVAHWLIRALWFGVVADDGSYCRRCGYQIGAPAAAPSIVVCPECGTARAGARHPLAGLIRAFDRARRAARPTLGVLVGASLIAAAATVYRGAPVARFLLRFDAMGVRNQAPGSITDWGTAGPSGATAWRAAGAVYRLDDGKGTVLVVRYAADVPRGLPPMQIMLGVESAVAGAGIAGSSIGYGTPYVVCDLNGAQAEHVVRHGLPAGLIDAFRAASTSGWVGTTGAAWPPPVVRIEPEPFFPADGAGR